MFFYIVYGVIMWLWMSLSMNQRINQGQTIELKQSLIQKFKKSAKALRWKVYPPENDVLVIATLIENFLWNLEDEDIKSILKSIFEENDIKKMMLDEAILLSMPKKANTDKFAYKYFFKNILEEQERLENKGEYIDNQEKIKPFHEDMFVQVIKNREEVEREVERLKNLMRTEWGQSLWLLEDLRTKNNVLNLVDEDMIKSTEIISHVSQFLLTKKVKKEWDEEKDLESDVLWFLRERVILDEITEFSSERLLKRFLTKLPSFSYRTEHTNCKDLRYRTMDVIWEFILISLGIISPEMFRLQKFSLEPEKIDDLIKNTDTTMEELEILFKYYNLRGINGKPIFYNRRFTKNQIPSKESDQLVRDFLLQMKEHREEIFIKFGYKEFEKNVILIKRDEDLGDEEKEEAIIEELNNRLSNENFMKEISRLLSNYRYKDIYQLINAPQKTK